MSLFDATPIAAAASTLRDAPLADRMRPRTLDEFVGQEHLLGPGKPLALAIAMTAVACFANQTYLAVEDISGSGPIAGTATHSPPSVVRRILSVPSPPSAIGFVTTHSSGRTESNASRTMSQARDAVRLSLNLSSATTIFTARL